MMSKSTILHCADPFLDKAKKSLSSGALLRPRRRTTPTIPNRHSDE